MFHVSFVQLEYIVSRTAFFLGDNQGVRVRFADSPHETVSPNPGRATLLTTFKFKYPDRFPLLLLLEYSLEDPALTRVRNEGDDPPILGLNFQQARHR